MGVCAQLRSQGCPLPSLPTAQAFTSLESSPTPCLTQAPSYILGPPSDASTSPQAYLLKGGMLSPGAVKMTRDLMNKDVEFYKSFIESLQSDIIFSTSDK